MKLLNKLAWKDTKFYCSMQCQAAFNHLKNALSKIPILQYSNINKAYTLFIDASNYAFSIIITQAIDVPDDLRLIAYTSGSFLDVKQGCSSTEKVAFAVNLSVLKFHLYLRGAQCILHCDLKPLEPFLTCGMKIPKLNHFQPKVH